LLGVLKNGMKEDVFKNADEAEDFVCDCSTRKSGIGAEVIARTASEELGDET
jgi:hypothetical protein